MRKRRERIIPFRKTDFRERVISEGLRQINTEKLLLIKQFFEGNLASYLKTPAAEKELERVLNDDKLFWEYRRALRVPGATKLIADFLKSREGTEAFITGGKNDTGLRVLIKLGQIPEGRKVARHMIVSPLRGWPAMYKILKELGNYKRKEGNVKMELPSFDLSGVMKSEDPLKDMLPMLRDEEKIGPVFISLSESDKAAKLCIKLLQNKEVRKLLFDYLVSRKTDSEAAFEKLFSSKARRERISGIFMSSGGTKLLADLAGNVTGRTIMTNLAISGHGSSIGMKVLMKHPLTIIKVGVNYFREPKS